MKFTLIQAIPSQWIQFKKEPNTLLQPWKFSPVLSSPFNDWYAIFLHYELGHLRKLDSTQATEIKENSPWGKAPIHMIQSYQKCAITSLPALSLASQKCGYAVTNFS